jgi:hypothetical protein
LFLGGVATSQWEIASPYRARNDICVVKKGNSKTRIIYEDVGSHPRKLFLEKTMPYTQTKWSLAPLYPAYESSELQNVFDMIEE